MSILGRHVGREQRFARDIALRPHLTGEAYVGRQAQFVEDTFFDRFRAFQTARVAGSDQNPASRAASATAANRGMGDIADPAGLEERRALRDQDPPTAWVGDADSPFARGNVDSQLAGQENAGNKCCVAV